MVVFYRSVQRGGKSAETLVKSDSPNMVAHPESYVKFDVRFWEGAAWSSQALRFLFRALGRSSSLKKNLLESPIFSVVN